MNSTKLEASQHGSHAVTATIKHIENAETKIRSIESSQLKADNDFYSLPALITNTKQEENVNIVFFFYIVHFFTIFVFQNKIVHFFVCNLFVFFKKNQNSKIEKTNKIFLIILK